MLTQSRLVSAGQFEGRPFRFRCVGDALSPKSSAVAKGIDLPPLLRLTHTDVACTLQQDLWECLHECCQKCAETKNVSACTARSTGEGESAAAHAAAADVGPEQMLAASLQAARQFEVTHVHFAGLRFVSKAHAKPTSGFLRVRPSHQGVAVTSCCRLCQPVHKLASFAA